MSLTSRFKSALNYVILTSSVGILFGSLATSIAAEPLDRATTKSDESSEIKLLKQIEERVLPLPLVEGVARHESLSNYYWETNIALRYRLDEAIRAFTSRKPARYRAMTIVAGPAGVGKTFTKHGVYAQWIPRDEVWKLDVHELFEEMAKKGLAKLKPDLGDHGYIISRLLTLNEEGRKEFARQLNQHTRSFLVVDSLDEIHPDDYYFVLNTLEQLALRRDRDFIHVVVFGRPLAFWEYWRDRRSEGLPDGLRGYILNPPDFRTTGDLLVSSWNYDCWKHKLSRGNSESNCRPMTLPEYTKWCKCDFATSGEFADVRYQPNKCIRPEVRDELLKWSQRHRVALAVFRNLAGNSILRDMVAESVEQEREFNDREFMNEFFARWLMRDTKTGDRPSRLKTENLELYLKLLEAVAVKYVRENRVSRLGYFDVVDDDHVVVEHEGKMVSVPVRRLLNRSGLVTLDPLLPVAARYRFKPFWIHRHLVLMDQQREAGQLNNAPPNLVGRKK